MPDSIDYSSGRLDFYTPDLPAENIHLRITLDSFELQAVPSKQEKAAAVLRPKRKITFEEEQTDGRA